MSLPWQGPQSVSGPPVSNFTSLLLDWCVESVLKKVPHRGEARWKTLLPAAMILTLFTPLRETLMELYTF